MYSYPITPEDMKVIFLGFLLNGFKSRTSYDIATKYAEYFDYDAVFQDFQKEEKEEEED